MQRARVAAGQRPRLLRETPQRGQVLLVGPLGGQLQAELLQHDAGLEHLVETGVHPVQVQHHGVDHGVHRRLGDHQAAAGPAPGPGHLLVLDQADRLAEDGPADLVALEQVGLRPEDLADRPAQRHDVLDDLIGHLRGALGLRVGARTRHVAPRPSASSSGKPIRGTPHLIRLDLHVRQKSGPQRCSRRRPAYHENMICEQGVRDVPLLSPPPSDPVAAPPARRPGSVRRTSTMLMFWPDGLGTDLHLKGRARDLLTPVDGEPVVRRSRPTSTP